MFTRPVFNAKRPQTAHWPRLCTSLVPHEPAHPHQFDLMCPYKKLHASSFLRVPAGVSAGRGRWPPRQPGRTASRAKMEHQVQGDTQRDGTITSLPLSSLHPQKHPVFTQCYSSIRASFGRFSFLVLHLKSLRHCELPFKCHTTCGVSCWFVVAFCSFGTVLRAEPEDVQKHTLHLPNVKCEWLNWQIQTSNTQDPGLFFIQKSLYALCRAPTHSETATLSQVWSGVCNIYNTIPALTITHLMA